MSGTPDLFTHLSQLSDITSVSIADGRSCLVSGEGVVQASFQIKLQKMLYVLDFSVNLLSINAITKQLHCCVTFFPFHCTFQNCRRGRGLAWTVSGDMACICWFITRYLEDLHLWRLRLSLPFCGTTDLIIHLIESYNRHCLGYHYRLLIVSHVS